MAISSPVVGGRIAVPRAVTGWAKAGSLPSFFIGPGWLLEQQVRINRKDGSTRMPNISTMPASAGINVSKRTLDVAVTGSTKRFTAPNDADGHALIADRL